MQSKIMPFKLAACILNFVPVHISSHFRDSCRHDFFSSVGVIAVVIATSPVSLYEENIPSPRPAFVVSGSCLLYYNGPEIALFLVNIPVDLSVMVMFHAQRLAVFLLI
jgi:hypothetical protein